MNELSQQVDKLVKDYTAVETANQKLMGANANYALNAVATFIKTSQISMVEIADILRESESYDKDLGKVISGAISKAITEFSKIKAPTINVTPNVTVTPNVNVDLKPIADELSKQNKTIIELLNKLPTDTKDDSMMIECYKLIVGMVAKNNQLLEKAFSQPDNSKQVISEMKVQRDRNGDFEKLIPVYK